MKTKKKLKEPIKVRLEWADETFDFAEFVQMVINFRKNKEQENREVGKIK